MKETYPWVMDGKTVGQSTLIDFHISTQRTAYKTVNILMGPRYYCKLEDVLKHVFSVI